MELRKINIGLVKPEDTDQQNLFLKLKWSMTSRIRSGISVSHPKTKPALRAAQMQPGNRSTTLWALLNFQTLFQDSNDLTFYFSQLGLGVVPIAYHHRIEGIHTGRDALAAF